MKEELTIKDIDLFFIERTAIHEPGHAIMCLYYGFNFQFVTIEPGFSDINRGLVRRIIKFWEHNQLIERNERYLKANCIESLAGIVCEYKMGYIEDCVDLTEYLYEIFFESFDGSDLSDVDFIYEKIDTYFSYKYPNTNITYKRLLNYFKKIVSETILKFTDINGKDTELWNYVLLLSEELLKKHRLEYDEVCALIPNLKGRSSINQKT